MYILCYLSKYRYHICTYYIHMDMALGLESWSRCMVIWEEERGGAYVRGLCTEPSPEGQHGGVCLGEDQGELM